MGDIYKAQDARLHRMVAIKALTNASAGDSDRRRRFIQEAQAASGLNHPNIITIYDIVSEEDSEYMVMELVSGKTLADLIPPGGMGVEKTLQYSAQMADALRAAHAAGIVHRDLKPGNVMVTDSGLVKILDFGLAKINVATELTEETQTIGAAPLTVEGSILGTVAYMSPEQAQGKKVDARSDIFSFGVVMYEMLTGTKAFPGDSAITTLTAILRDDVKPIAELVPDVPPELVEIITLALAQGSQGPLAEYAGDAHRAGGAEGEVRFRSDEQSGVRGAAGKAEIAATIVAAAEGSLASAATGGRTGAGRAEKVAEMGVDSDRAELRVLGNVRTLVEQQRACTEEREVARAIDRDAARCAGRSGRTGFAEERASSVLTNQSIIDLVAAEVPEAVIIGHIRASKTKFDLSTSEIIRLSNSDVPAAVIEAMRNPSAAGNPASSPPAAAPPPVPPAAETRRVPRAGRRAVRNHADGGRAERSRGRTAVALPGGQGLSRGRRSGDCQGRGRDRRGARGR